MDKNEVLLAMRAAIDTLSFAQSSVLQTPKLPSNDIFVDVAPNRVSVLSSGVVTCQPQLLGSPLGSPELRFLPLPANPVTRLCARCHGSGVEPP